MPPVAQKIFGKFNFFKRSKEKDYRDRPREIWPTAIGISDSSCEINGDPFNGWKLPIPAPEKRALSTCAHHRESQNLSKFFRLPVEVRKMIYTELMGNRRVHIEYSWMFQSPFEPPTKRGGKRWNWFHGVCQNSNDFCEDAYLDRCDDRGDERWNARKMSRLTSAPPETKLHGVEWLRCCQMGYVFFSF